MPEPRLCVRDSAPRRPALEFPVPKRRLRRAVSADPRSGGSGTEAATAEAEVWEVDGGAHRRRRLRSGGEAGEWEELEAGGRKAAIESTGSSVLDRARCAPGRSYTRHKCPILFKYPTHPQLVD